jgi:Tfp pilus assembly protein PilV
MSLIEVFVALLVLSVGLIALAKLQVDLVRGGSDARSRTVALDLAEQKIEDLRTFAAISDPTACPSWSTSASPMCWSYIATNAGGRIASGNLTIAGVQFNLAWSSALSTFGTGATAGSTNDVAVTVSWVNQQGATQTVTSNGSIVNVAPGSVLLGSQPVSAPGSPPSTLYTPGSAPEVVAIPLNNGYGGKRETTKPLPTVSKSDTNTMVSFETVNYHLVGSQNLVDTNEPFRTVNCHCQLAGAGPGLTPARHSFVGGVLRDRPGVYVASKPETGTASGNDSSVGSACNICCRDHHDGPQQTIGGSTDYNRYNPTAGSDHKHYVIGGSTPVGAGGVYDEACRLKIVNGLLQVYQDWQLQTVTVMPESDMVNLDGSNGPNYSNYQTAVQKFVMGVASAQAGIGSAPTNLLTWFTPGSVSINPATSQLLARAIYIDYMPSNLLTAINGILTDGNPANDSSIMSMVPYYEVHMTKLADWSVYPDLNNALVSSAPVVTDSSGAVGTLYSRGFVQPAATPPGGTPTILASIKSHNTGVTDTSAVSPSYEVPHSTTAQTVSGTTHYYTSTNPNGEAPTGHGDGTLNVTVAANAKNITITGTFQQASGSATISGNVGASIGGVSCSTTNTTKGKNWSETFTCTVTADSTGNWSGTVNFSSASGYAFCLSDNAVKSGKTYTTMCTAMSGGNWALGPLSGNSTGTTIYVSTVF